MRKTQCFIPASAKTTRTNLWEQLLLSVVAVFFVLFFFRFWNNLELCPDFYKRSL